ncbi:MAG: hypothetical protein LC635_00745 [Pseudonocardiaceae bacterium]|nr:hypothetical protein [Pseudonocardiaceae bacterium]
MDVARYNIDAINGCVQKALDHKPKFGAVSDTFPEACAAPAAYGTLSSSAAVSSAVDALNDLMHDEFDAAENRLSGVAAALDAVVRSVQNNERAGVTTFRGV